MCGGEDPHLPQAAVPAAAPGPGPGPAEAPVPAEAVGTVIEAEFAPESDLLVAPEAVVVCRDARVVAPGFRWADFGGLVPRYDAHLLRQPGSIVTHFNAFLEFVLNHIPHPRDAPEGVRRQVEEAGYIPDRKELMVVAHDDCRFIQLMLDEIGNSGPQGTPERPHVREALDMSLPGLVRLYAPELRAALLEFASQELRAGSENEALVMLRSLPLPQLQRTAEAEFAFRNAARALEYPSVRTALADGRLDDVVVHRFFTGSKTPALRSIPGLRAMQLKALVKRGRGS